MAELTHFYAEDNTLVDSATDDLTVESILGSTLTANTKYLIVARALTGGSSVSGNYDMWVETADDTTIATKSLHKMEPEQTGNQALVPFFFVHSYETDASPADVLLKVTSSTGESRADQMTLFLLDLDAIGESGYWDGTVTDNEAVWTNDANIADGDLTTAASSSTTGSATSNEIRIASNQHPTSGDVLEPVTFQLYGFTGSGGQADNCGFEVFDGGTSLVSGTFSIRGTSGEADWTTPVHVPAPSGGWTAAKMEGLTVAIWQAAGADSLSIARVDFRTEYVEHRPNSYVLSKSGVLAGEYSTTAATTQAAELPGAALSTDEYLILGYARADIGSTGRWFKHSLHAADDTSTAAERSFHQAEGEDTNEQRIVGFALRHKASSGTPNVTLYGEEQAANGNMIDGGAYLIALPTSLFADFKHDYTAAVTDTYSIETTLATVASYTPSVDGNHLVIGHIRQQLTGAGFTDQLVWVEDGTTEIRTGDSTPSHNQKWDDDADREIAVTFQRYSITGATTLNLQGDTASAGVKSGDTWLLVVNLNEPAVAAVYPPFPRRQNTLVRM